MPSEGSRSAVVLELAEEFLQRYRDGQRPSLKEYVDRRPDLAGEIREVFPAMALMENIAIADESLAEASQQYQRPEALEKLGDYRIIRLIGRGGMGLVYEAEQLSLRRHVALKVLPPGALLEPRQVERFEREAVAAAKLHHTNIVPVYGVGHENGLHYYVMQFIQGQPLDAVLGEVRRLRPGNAPARAEASTAAQGLLSGQFGDPASRECHSPGTLPRPPGSGLSGSGRPYWQSVARMGAQVADALAYAHAQGTLHRDIKPSNLLLDAHGIVWVTDFGLAKASDSADLTGTGEIVGTLRFIPPERFGGVSDGLGDIYSLGLTLYELLTLRPAFDAEDRFRLIEQILHSEPPSPRKLNLEVPRDLETVVLKAMTRDPSRRYASARDLADDLQRFAQDRPVRARPPRPGERLVRWCRRNPAVAALLLTVAVTLVAGAAVATFFAFEARKQEVAALANAAGERAEKQRVGRLLYNARMNLAQNFLRDLKFKELRELLTEMKPAPDEADLRGFEYWYLWREINSTSRTLRLNDFEPNLDAVGVPSSLMLSPDGRRLAQVRFRGPHRSDTEPGLIASMTSRLKVWDTADGRALATTDQATAGGVVLSPDGRLAAWRTPEGKVVVWDIGGGKVHSAWPGKPSRRGMLVFDHRGERLGVLEWDPPPAAERTPLGSSTVGVADIPYTLRVRNLAAGREVLTLNLEGRGSGRTSLLFTPDGREIVVSLGEKSWEYRDRVHVRLWTVRSAADGAERLKFDESQAFNGPPHLRTINSPDGRWLVVSERTVEVWDLHSGQKVPVKFSGTADLERPELAFSPDGKTLAVSTGMGYEVRLFDIRALGESVEPSAPPRQLMGEIPATRLLRGPSAVRQLAFTSDGSRLLAVGGDGVVHEWDMTRSDRTTLKGLHMPRANSLLFSGDGQRLAAIALGELGPRLEPQVGVWDTSGRQLVRRSANQGDVLPLGKGMPSVPPGGGTALDLSADGRRLAYWSVPSPRQNRDVAAWAVGGIGTANGPGLLSTTGLWVGVFSPPAPVRVLDVDAGRDLFTLPPEAAPVQFSPDGRLLTGGNIGWFAQRGVDPMLFSYVFARGTRAPFYPAADWHVWDATTGQPVLTQRSPAGSRVAVAFRPDGRRLAVWTARGPESGELTLWDLDAGRRLFSQPWPNQPQSNPVRLLFSPDGRRLAAVGCESAPDGPFALSKQLTLWDVEDDEARVLMEKSGGTLSLQEHQFVVFSPDSASLAADVGSPAVTIWDTRTGKQRSVLRGLGSSPTFFGFSADGRRLLTMDVPPLEHSALKCGLWDVETGQEVLSLPLSNPFYSTLHFDGRHILLPSILGEECRVIDGSP